MRIVFRIHIHTSAEIKIGHKMGFTSIPDIDAVSATANTEGFTPLNAVARFFGWDRELIHMAAVRCNKRREVAIVDQVSPTLLLVPRLVGYSTLRDTFEGNAVDLLMATRYLKIKRLHFTHFGFIQSSKATSEFERILEIFLNPLCEPAIENLTWEIDARGLQELQNAFRRVRLKFRLPECVPDAVLAPRFKWSSPVVSGEKFDWCEFIPAT